MTAPRKIHEICLFEEDGAPGAFDPAKLDEAGIEGVELILSLTTALHMYARLLQPGCGFALMNNGDHFTVVGLARENA